MYLAFKMMGTQNAIAQGCYWKKESHKSAQEWVKARGRA